jgi:hypothetical protein
MMNKCKRCNQEKDFVRNKLFHDIDLCTDCLYGVIRRNEE